MNGIDSQGTVLMLRVQYYISDSVTAPVVRGPSRWTNLAELFRWRSEKYIPACVHWRRLFAARFAIG